MASDVAGDSAGGAPRCPYCDRVMSARESWEQGSCNDCYTATGRELPDLGTGTDHLPVIGCTDPRD